MTKVRFTLLSLTMASLLALGIGYAYSADDDIENLLDNGNLESGLVAPWGSYGTATLTVVDELEDAFAEEDPIEGDFSLHIAVAAKGANFWDSGLQHQGHVFKKDKFYTLSCFLKSKEGPLQINFKPELGVDPWPGFGEKAFTMTEEWEEYYVTTPKFFEDIIPATITFHIAYTPGEFWIDDVKFYEGEYIPTEIEGKDQPVESQDKLAITWGNVKAD